LQRLESAMATGRSWEPALFQSIWVGHPLMRQVARRLLWIATR
jgi:hypothetical protein